MPHQKLTTPGDEMGAHGFKKAVIAAFVEQVKILIGEQRNAIGRSGRESFSHFLSY